MPRVLVFHNFVWMEVFVHIIGDGLHYISDRVMLDTGTVVEGCSNMLFTLLELTCTTVPVSHVGPSEN